MTAAQWTVVLMATGGGLTWATYVARLLWNFRGKWDTTNDQLAGLARQIEALVNRDNMIEQRLERHLDWHDRH